MGNGFQIRVGVEPIAGCDIILSHEPISFLHQHGLFCLNHARRPLDDDNPQYWRSAVELGLMEEAEVEWNAFVKQLAHASIVLSEDLDTLFWCWQEECGESHTCNAYQSIVQLEFTGLRHWWFNSLWQWPAPLLLKFVVFVGSFLTTGL